ncbi:hypothetical protein WA026_006348 [Henosepilachna vigintioctopunctata]|uniref:Uncharacterized protein n=1 Tax=Henosepilachna vigintioctopunctata TaxID=420089 RepID=A0AAW1TR60_9CUCU
MVSNSTVIISLLFFFELDMEVHIIKLVVWAVATLGIYGEANDEYDNIRNQRDIIRGGIYDNNNYAPANINSDSESILVDNTVKNNYQTQTQLDNNYNDNEWAHKPSSNFFGYKNNEDYKRYTNTIYNKDNNMKNSFIGRNNEQLNSLYSSYQGDSRTLQNAVINGANNEVNTAPKINPAGRVSQNYPGPFNSYIPIHLSRRIIVPVPTAIPAKLHVSQVPNAPYLAPYQVHPSVPYTDKLPIAAPVSIEAAVPNQYPVESPHPAAVGIQQPALVNLPQSYYMNNGNKDIVEYGGNSENILNNKSPAVNENVLIYRQPSGYHNSYPGNTDTQFNSLTFGTSQKPVHGTFRNTYDYYSYPSPNVSENFKADGNSQSALYNGYIQSGRNYKLMNSNKYTSSRYPNSKPYGRLRQGKALNVNKNIYGFAPPCYFHRRSGFRH